MALPWGLWVLLVVAIIVLAVATAVVIVVGQRRTLGIDGIAVREIEPGVWAVRTPYGRGTIRDVMHPDRGHVFEVRTVLRGQGEHVAHVPPTLAMARQHLHQRLDALTSSEVVRRR